MCYCFGASFVLALHARHFEIFRYARVRKYGKFLRAWHRSMRMPSLSILLYVDHGTQIAYVDLVPISTANAINGQQTSHKSSLAVDVSSAGHARHQIDFVLDHGDTRCPCASRRHLIRTSRPHTAFRLFPTQTIQYTTTTTSHQPPPPQEIPTTSRSQGQELPYYELV